MCIVTCNESPSIVAGPSSLASSLRGNSSSATGSASSALVLAVKKGCNLRRVRRRENSSRRDRAKTPSWSRPHAGARHPPPRWKSYRYQSLVQTAHSSFENCGQRRLAECHWDPPGHRPIAARQAKALPREAAAASSNGMLFAFALHFQKAASRPSRILPQHRIESHRGDAVIPLQATHRYFQNCSENKG